jgi:hypothetical protein
MIDPGAARIRRSMERQKRKQVADMASEKDGESRTEEPLGVSAASGAALDSTGVGGFPTEPEADFVPLSDASPGGGQREEEIDPFQYDSLQAQKAFDEAVAAQEAGRAEEAVEHYIRASKTAETAGEWYLAAVSCQRVGDFLANPRPPYDMERAFRMYRRAVAAYERCGLFAEARALAYYQMVLKLRRARELKLPLFQRIELFLFWATSGFGYRPLRVVATAATTILLYGSYYWMTGGIVQNHAPGPVDLRTAIYFSGITFATVGYGDFVPAPAFRLVALTEGFLGAMLMGLFVAVLAHRLSST